MGHFSSSCFSIPFSVDDLSKSMDQIDISDIEPPPLIRENSGFSFLLPRADWWYSIKIVKQISEKGTLRLPDLVSQQSELVNVSNFEGNESITS